MDKLRDIVVSRWFYNFVVTLIILNAIVLGLETYPAITQTYGPLLSALDNTFTVLFVIELCLEMIVLRKKFFSNPWHMFDLIVVSISLIPAGQAFTVLRAARVLRVLRLVSAFPSLRRVVQGLINAIPGISSIAGILLILFYVFGVMATRLFGQNFPEYFGSLQSSFFSLFQIMTLEGWPDIVRKVMEIYPYAWVFFITYILIATFSVLNLFIAVIVDAMQTQHEMEEKEEQIELKTIEDMLTAINQKLENLQSKDNSA
ncbi:Ion transport protein [Legionella beliardensis]|uniref:Ion transport protein n=1 Tax=Legionella beliardensis TaxID=91822 RepID=A0A378I015_9GAMM|nr:ion transporter [Legionella beliardensis]STX28538.1 Ion transport protein [Legionella beliardensis]